MDQADAPMAREADGPRDWHAMSVEDVLAAMGGDASGLTSSEAEERLSIHGLNRLPQARGRGPLARFALQFNNLLIYVLIVAAIISFLLGHAIDAAVIMGVVVINAVVGFVQEGKAERALEAIRSMIDPHARVLRDGMRISVAAERIVPGDIVLIEAGDRVPADLRVIRARSLKVDESILTGESVPVDKDVSPVPDDAALGDRTSMAFSGTLVAAGQGAGIVVGTGASTELGHISTLIGTVETLKTPLIRQMDVFAKQLTFIILAISALTFLAAYFLRAYSADEAFMVVVGLAVAAIPEGLPAVMTIALAIGVQRMAARKAIIRRLPAVETLGSVSVICSDKTGTLTRNEMTARAVVTAACEYEATGVGYQPDGGLSSRAGDEVDLSSDPVLPDLIRAGVLCNNAEIRQADGAWVAAGDPMEAALVTLATKAGVDVGSIRRQFARDDEIPFDSRHRFMATLHSDEDEERFILIKGAPERVLDMCSSERHAEGDTEIDHERWREEGETLAARGQRVLAFAFRPAGEGQTRLRPEEVESGAVLLGLVGFIDPPREEAIDAVADCRTAGIRVIMITGDHVVTAREIARQLGIDEEPKALTGAEIEEIGDDALREALRSTAVFARTTPEHKLRLVQALQSDGLTVAMTGDGVNDAPALKRADVGVAMGKKGTEAAKEAASMVLTDDNFASIVAAVKEGRTVYDNLRKVIAWTLPTNGGEALTIIAAIAAGYTLPITPVQILWVNMITAVALGLTLAFEPPEKGVMQRPPRPPGQPLLTGVLLWQVLFVSVLFVIGTFGMFFWAESRGLGLEQGRTIVVNTLVVMEIAYLFSVRYVHGTSFTLEGVIGTPAVLIGLVVVVVAQLAFTYLPPMQFVFETRSLGVMESGMVVAVGVALLLAVEAEKEVRRRLWPTDRPRGLQGMSEVDAT